VFEEIRKIGKLAKPYHIVKGSDYIYFCVQPTQDNMVFQQTITKPNLSLISIYNVRDNIVGYLVKYKGKPFLNISENAEGVGIFFTDNMTYKKPKVLYSNQKVRVLQFGSKDFYVSIKWKTLAKED
jgi:hypothetical protein